MFRDKFVCIILLILYVLIWGFNLSMKCTYLGILLVLMT